VSSVFLLVLLDRFISSLSQQQYASVIIYAMSQTAAEVASSSAACGLQARCRAALAALHCAELAILLETASHISSRDPKTSQHDLSISCRF
jgi:hypothetical protein